MNGRAIKAIILKDLRVVFQNKFQDAYQMGALLVLPVILLVLGQAAGVIYFSPWLVVLLGLVLWALDAALLWLGGRIFQRSALAARL